MPIAVDISNYSGVPTESALRCWRGYGVTKVICGTQRPSITAQQLHAALSLGFRCDIYTYMYFSMPADTQVRAGASLAQSFDVDTHWLDFEDDPRMPVGRTVEYITRAVTASVPFPTGIYTRRGWWYQHTGNTAAFRGLPLWDARYILDKYQDRIFNPQKQYPRVPFISYGGWTEPAITQWHNSTEFCGVTVDVNDIHTLEIGERMKYTDQVLDEIIGNLLGSLQHALGVATETTRAFVDHVQTHPTAGFSANDDDAGAIKAIKAELTELNDRLERVAEVLKGAGQ